MRILQPLVLVLAVCCLAACDPQSVLVWSPSGQRLAVLTNDGLRIWSDDKLSAPLIKGDVHAILWLPDSSKAIVATTKGFSSWQELLEAVAPSQRQDILSTAEKLKGPILRSRGELNKEEQSSLENLPECFLAVVYLTLHDRDELKEALGSKWHDFDFDDLKVESIIQSYDIGTDKAIPGAVILRKFGTVEDMRLSPDGKYLLCATDSSFFGSARDYELSVASTTGDAQEIVANHAALSPDWTPDSLSVVYISKNDDTNSSQALNLGSVIKKPVRSSNGALLHKAVGDKAVASDADKTTACIPLASIPFNSSNRVRCLKNGSLLMSCGELRLPALPSDPVDDNLFILPATGPISSVLTLADRQMLSKTVYFVLNPSENLAAIETENGSIYLLNLQSCSLTQICEDNKFTPIKTTEVTPGWNSDSMPSWRSDSELCFVAGPGKKDAGKKPQVILWSVTSGTSRKLSSGWPGKVLEGL